MTYPLPQQQSAQPSGGGQPNRLALWVNTRKQSPNQPDYKGNVEITWELLQEMLAAFNAGQYTTDYGQRPCIKLDVAIYAQQPDQNKPVMSGRLSTVAETAQANAARAAAKAQAQGGYQQAPQQQFAPAPAAPQPVPQQAPAPVQQAAPVYQQAPMPQAPMPVAQPMPGAIHGQPPAQPIAAQQLPPGF